MVSDENLQKIIDDIDYVRTGVSMKDTLYETLSSLQYIEFMAKSLGGYQPGDFVTGDMVEKIYYGKTSNASQVFDSMPKSNSKKAVRASGIEYSIGNMKELYLEYDNIFYVPKSNNSSNNDNGGDDVDE